MQTKRFSFSLVALFFGLWCANPLHADTTYNWNGQGGDSNWTTSNNWYSGNAPTPSSTSNIEFSYQQPNVDSYYNYGGTGAYNSFESIIFDNTLYAYMHLYDTGNRGMDLYGGIFNNSTKGVDFDVDVAFNVNNAVIAATSSQLIFNNAHLYTNGNTIQFQGSQYLQVNGAIQDPGATAGSVVINRTGNVVQFTNSGNNYAGGTTITAGTLQLSGAGTTGSSSGTMTINGGTFDLNGDNVNTSRTVGALNGSGGTVANNNSGTYFTNFNVGQGNGSGSYAGSIVDHTGSGTGLVIVNKVGTGTQSLTGASSYSFGTNVNGGALRLANTSGSALTGSGRVTVNSDATLVMGANNQIATAAPITLGGGTLDAGGQSQGTGGTAPITNPGTVGIGNLSLFGASTISLTSTSVLHFANSSSNTWTGTLSILAWTGTATTGGGAEQILFGTSPTGLSAFQLSQISFVNPTGYAPGTYGATFASDGTGEIVPLGLTPIPEPGSTAGVILLLGGLVWFNRRALILRLRGSAARSF